MSKDGGFQVKYASRAIAIVSNLVYIQSSVKVVYSLPESISVHFQSTLQCCTFRLVNVKVRETRASANNFLLHSSDGKTIWNCSELHKSPTPVNKPPQKNSKNLASSKVKSKEKLCENILEHPQSFICVMRKLTPQAPSTCGWRSCEITFNTPGLIHSTAGPTFIMQHRLTAVLF